MYIGAKHNSDKKIEYSQKKCLTARGVCDMIILPLQKGSFFVP